MEKRLYQWQEECLSHWFANNGRGMVQAVTGSGKTLLALTAAARLDKALGQSLRIKIVVPTSVLMRQWERNLREFLTASHTEEDFSSLRGKIGLRGCGCKADPNCKYMIYVINSARYELARQILAELRSGEDVLLIADECHRYASGQNQLIFEFLPYIEPYTKHFYSLGLSATLPSGKALHYLSSVLGRKIYSYGMAEASARRTVCPYDICHIGLDFNKKELDEYEELTDRLTLLYQRLIRLYPQLGKTEPSERCDLIRRLSGDKNKKIAETAASYLHLSYNRKSLVCLASARIDCTCDLIERLEPDEKILIFGERICQAEELYQFLQERYPGQVGRYHYKMGQQANKNSIERFRTGTIRILIACKSMDEGVDVPDAAVGIILSGASTKRQRIQRLGRIIRKKEGKRRAALYYLHITQSSEDICFLPDSGEARILELEYLSGTGTFSNPLYDPLAEAFLNNIKNSGAENSKIREAGVCLELGCVRSDWLMEPNEIEEQIRLAASVRQKNYWICMKKLREYHARTEKGIE